MRTLKQRFEVLEVLVVGAEQRLDPLFGDGDLLHRLAERHVTPSSISDSERPRRAAAYRSSLSRTHPSSHGRDSQLAQLLRVDRRRRART